MDATDWRTIVRMNRPSARLHASTKFALGAIQDWTGDAVNQWDVYVDGSSAGQTAGWGIVALAHTSAGLRYAGCGWAKISGTNNAAELTAAGMAAMLALILPGKCPVVVDYDNALVAGAIDMARWFKANTNQARAATISAMRARRLRNLSTRHTYSHTSHPWNELADTLAAGKHDDIEQAAIRENPMAQATSLDNLEHLVTLQTATPGTLPPVIDGRVCLTASDPPALDPEWGMSIRNPRSVSKPDPCFQCAVGQANVLTMETAKDCKTENGLLECGTWHTFQTRLRPGAFTLFGP